MTAAVMQLLLVDLLIRFNGRQMVKLLAALTKGTAFLQFLFPNCFY
jgi:hypothetical protein